uniref:Auxin Efflux Carrier family protein n=3 Tax=Oryza sativa subsp. japonica TaxID=39947 RepID=Q2RB75_ORYSJ|nr:Auxin Efflux Carrier family protein [Oryza sativa Japonica Group]
MAEIPYGLGSHMIGWVDIGKILSAIAPLYFALVLGYCSSKRWWRIFTAEDSEAIMVAWFALPFFTFEFTLHLDPYNVRYSLIAADSISKLIIVIVIGIGVGLIFRKEGLCTAVIDWCISGFSLASLTNSLVVGVPMARAMYGNWAGQVVVQLSIFQAIVWLTSLMVVLEVRKAFVSDAHDESNRHEEGSYIDDDTVVGGSGTSEDMQSLEEGVSDATNQDLKGEEAVTVAGVNGARLPLFKSVARKLACNPNLHASVIGISWACISNRSHLTLPPALEGSVQIMSRSGLGLAMFSMGCNTSVYFILHICQGIWIACRRPEYSKTGGARVPVRLICRHGTAWRGATKGHVRERDLMIGWVDIGKILSAITLLYFALALGYCSSRRWWQIFTAEDSEAINRMVVWFAFPFFTFEFTLHLDPYNVRCSLIAADSIAKLIIVAAISIGVMLKFRKEGLCAAVTDWCISGFSLASLTNSLVVGMPMARAMYGNWAGQIVVQLSIFQAIVWLTSLVVVLEVRKAFVSDAHDESNSYEEGSFIDDDTVVGSSGTSEDMQSLEEGVSDATNQDLRGEEAVSVAVVNGARLPLFKSVARRTSLCHQLWRGRC